MFLRLFIISIFVALSYAYFNKEHRSCAINYLLWAVVPLGLFFAFRRVGIFKASILSIISPPVFIIFSLIFWAAITDDYTCVPDSIPYHTAADLKRITGVDFPNVTPVDSIYHEDFNSHETTIKFVPVRPLTKTFYSKLRHACVADPCCWKKEDDGYHYYILPEKPIDRPKGTHIRQVKQEDGQMKDDWQGDFIDVFVPLKGDTIYVKDGWAR